MHIKKITDRSIVFYLQTNLDLQKVFTIEITVTIKLSQTRTYLEKHVVKKDLDLMYQRV